MNKKMKFWRISLLSLGGFLFIFLTLQQLLMPKYLDSAQEGRLIAEYYEDEKENQVLFIGDCEVYENFTPITFWEEYGFTSYIRGGPQQLIWQSYYFLEEMLQYETPDVVVFNVLSMKYDTPQSEPYNRLNLDGMKWSSSKLNAIQSSMTSKEHLLTYLFPLFRYHDRIIELTNDDFTHLWETPPLSHNGYLMQTGVKPVTTIPPFDILADYSFGEQSYLYLDKMTALCKEKGIDLVLVKAPTIYPLWYPEWDAQMVDYAQEHDLLYVNFLDIAEEIGIDFQVDTYDAGLHLNVYGAEKLSHYFGAILSEEFQLEDRRNDVYFQNLWEEKATLYYADRNK